MASIVHFSFILFSLTLALGTYAAPAPALMKCYFEESSVYPSVAQYCTIVLDSPENYTKKSNDVCNEVESLFSEICSFNKSLNKNQFPQSQDVSESTCAVSCAKLPLIYLANLLGDGDSCESLCSEDPKMVAALLTVVQLKRFIAATKKTEEAVPTETTVKPIIAATKKTEEAVPTETTVKPIIAATKKIEEAVPTETTVKPIIAATKKTEEAVPTERTVKPIIAATKKTEEAVPRETTVKPIIAATKKTEEAVPTETTVKPIIAATKKTEKAVPTETTVKPIIAATKKTEEAVPTETTVKPIIAATKKTEEEAVPTETTVKPIIAVTTVDDGYPLDEVSTDADGNNSPKEPDTDTNNEDNENEKTKNSGTGEASKPSLIPEDTPSSYHFLAYFLTFIVLCVAGYIVFHNKQKIIAFIVEGKQGRRSGRPSTKQYTPLKSKVEDVMPYVEKSTTKTNYIY